jgi:hypothetical protein
MYLAANGRVSVIQKGMGPACLSHQYKRQDSDEQSEK